MARPWRLILLAAALNATAGAAAAAAQTVMVRSAPPGGTIELVLNSTTVATATADESGAATLAVNLASIGKTQTDVFIYVDVCENNLRRIVLAERGTTALRPGNCDRRDVSGLFYLRQISTLVMNIGTPVPTVLLRQGPYRPRPPRVWKPAPTGLVLSGAGAWTSMRDQISISCGIVEDCSGSNGGIGFSVGATYWLARWLGAEVTYIKPGKATTQGTASGFEFNSAFDADVVTISGTAGVPAGPIRVYGKGGGNFHSATLTTVQKLGEESQTLLLKTEGWGWGFGGGMEAWITSRFAIYGEFNFNILRGDAVGGVEGRTDDRLTSFVVGGRVRIGG